MRALAFVGMVLFAGSILAADKEKPLTAAQKKAVAKYDHLPDKWRDKAVEAWKKEFKSKYSNKATLLKNEPEFYPEIVSFTVQGEPQLLRDSWGVVSIPNPAFDQPGDLPGVYVVQVVDKGRALCKRSENLYFFVDGIDTSSLADKTACHIPGIFFVDGNATYTNLLGSTNTVRVVKPIPKDKPVKDSK